MPIPSYLTDIRNAEVQEALRALHALPSLTAVDVDIEDSCPICLIPYSAILEEEQATSERSQGDYNEKGVGPSQEATRIVRLSGCGHIFCQKDLVEWIVSQHGSCPACRQTFFNFTPIDEAEYESSDGGEYIPEEDEDDAFTDDGEMELIPTSDFEGDVNMGSDDEASLSDAPDEGSEDRFYHRWRRMNRFINLFDVLERLGEADVQTSAQDELSVDAVHSGTQDNNRENESSAVDECEVEESINDNSFDSIDSEGPFYGSEEISSEGTSYNEDDANIYAADINTAAGEECSSEEDIGHEIKPCVTNVKPNDAYVAASGTTVVQYTQ